MKWLKGIILGVILLAVGAVALGLFYFLPQHDVVMVTGVEVKRMDHNGVISAQNPADSRIGSGAQATCQPAKVAIR